MDLKTDYVTKSDLEEAMRKQTDEIVGILHTFMQDSSDRFQSIDASFEAMDARFDSIDARFDRIEAELRSVNEKYDHLLNAIDTFIGRIDNYETEMLARDRQFERLLAWARKVSEKTGIPLEDL